MNLLSYILIGWITGVSHSGQLVSIEFESLASCEIAKEKFKERHRMYTTDDQRRHWDSWVECVQK